MPDNQWQLSVLGALKKYFKQRGAGLFALLSAFSIFHIFIIVGINIPDGPLNSAIRSWSQAYTGLLFNQNWKLFAPEPKVDDRGYFIRARYDGNTSSWVDISSTPVNKKLANPLLPRKDYDMLEEAELELIDWESDDLKIRRNQRISHLSLEELTKHKDDKNYRYELVPITPREAEAKKSAEAFVFRVLAAYAAKVFPPGYRALQLRTIDIPARPPKFDNQPDAYGKDEPVTSIDSDWLIDTTL